MSEKSNDFLELFSAAHKITTLDTQIYYEFNTLLKTLTCHCDQAGEFLPNLTTLILEISGMQFWEDPQEGQEGSFDPDVFIEFFLVHFF